MRAVTAADTKLVIRDHRDPRPGPGEVLVEVRAAGVNGADIMQLRGFYPAPPGSPPDILGLEFAGEVLENGAGASLFKVGDRVMALVGGGGQAELVTADERVLIAVPDTVDWIEAGGFAEAFTTAHDALFTQAGLRAGDRLLVNGAAGGVGVAAVQLAHLAGAHVCATVRAEGLRADVARLGADLVTGPEEAGGHGPFDVVLELVGAPNMAANVEALALRGRVVVIGIGAGARAEIDLRLLMQRRGQVMASTLRSRPVAEKAECARRIASEVVPALATGRLHVPLAGVYGLEEADRAYDRFAAGGKLGKIVIDMAAVSA